MHTSTHVPLQRLRLGAFALGMLGLAAGQWALAQTAPATTTATTGTSTTTTAAGAASESQEVVVLPEYIVSSGYASSLLAAEGAKENASAITEDLAPEDLGKLPTVSVADALVTLTGLASQRTNGRDQMISIRGLGPDYQVGTWDGVEQATTNDNRGVEYDQYPAELVSGVTVYKTGQADRVGGIGGTIDLQTISPLAIDQRVVAVNAFYDFTQFKQLTPGVKKAGESYSVSYIDKFLNGTEGIYIGFSHTENPYQMQQFQSWGYPQDANGNYIIGGERIYATTDLLTRDAVVGILESQPNPNFHSKLDLSLSYFDENEMLRGLEIPMAFWSSANLLPGYTVSNGLITNYTLTNVQPVVRNMNTGRTDHLASGVWHLDLIEQSEWPIHVVTGASEVSRQDEVLEEYSGLGFNAGASDAATFQVTEVAGPNVPQISSNTNFSNPNLLSLTDPQGWGTSVFPVTGMEGYLKYFKERDIVDSAKVSTVHELDKSFLKDVELGISYTERFKQQGQNPSGYLVNADGKPSAALPPIIGSTDLGFAGNLSSIAYDPVAAYNDGYYTFMPNPNPGSWEGDNFKVWEKVTRPYAQLDMKGEILGLPWDGNIGGVVDLADQNSTGFSGNGGNVVYPVSGGANYATFLPSLNLVFRPTKTTDVRLSAGRQEARPPMYDMRAARDYGYNSTYATSTSISPWSATAGNPGIRPWLANSLDLSLEHYFDKGGGYVALAAFDKQLLSYIYQENQVVSFAGYPYTGSVAPTINYGLASQFVNGVGGHLSGVEGTMQLTSELLTRGAVHGFGVVVNGALTESAIQPWGPGNGTAPLDNLSKKVANVTFYYEYHGFSARVSDNYRSATREYITTFGAPTFSSLGTPNDGYSEEQPEHTIAAQLSYSFIKGYLHGLAIYIEGTNLNNEPLITYNNGDPRQIMNWQKYGASYKSGVSYKF